MIVLQSGSNYIVVTLTELTTITDAEYIMVLINDSTEKKYAFKLGTDLSSYPDRSNKFLVTVKDNPIPLSSEVNLSDGDYYQYFIYETADADTFNFDNIPNEISGLVEQGKLKYLIEESEKKYYKDKRSELNTYV